MKICYFGGYRDNYPRSRTQIIALRQAGLEVVECRVSHKLTSLQKMAQLLPLFWRQARGCDVILVAEFNQSVTPLAWMLARWTKAALVFDPAISYYDEMVITQQTASPGSLRGRYLYFLDRLAFQLSDLVLWYMPADCDYFENLFPMLKGKQAWSPPVMDEAVFKPLPFKTGGPFVVHLNSSYLPTHGVDVVLQAAQLLADDSEITFELVGGGPTYAASVALADSLKLTQVKFLAAVPVTELPALYQRADVCLGAFRDDAKLARLIELKIISALASARPVIAADSPLKRQFFRPDEDLVLVPAGDPAALAQAIRQLKADPAWRQRLAESGPPVVRKHFSSAGIGGRMTTILESAVNKRRQVGQDSTPPL